MRRCRVKFVSPPETISHGTSTENDSSRTKITLTSMIDQTNTDSKIQINPIDDGQLDVFQQQLGFDQILWYYTSNVDSRITDMYLQNFKGLVFYLCTKVFHQIINLYQHETYFCRVALVYFSYTSVMTKVYDIIQLCLTNYVLCLMLKMYLPKRPIELLNQTTLYLKISEQVRVVCPLSIWITTSPKKYLSKLILDKKIRLILIKYKQIFREYWIDIWYRHKHLACITFCTFESLRLRLVYFFHRFEYDIYIWSFCQFHFYISNSTDVRNLVRTLHLKSIFC